ncbi:MAG: FtsX-like permease family protein [Candidatus Thorarchaeota archaeon]
MAKTWKNVFRAINANKVRFVSIALIIAVGIVSFISMLSAFVHLDATYQGAFNDYDMASFTVQTANPGGSGSDAWIDYANLTNYLTEFAQEETRIVDFELRIIYDTIFEIRGNRQNGRIVAFSTTDSQGEFRAQPDVNGYELLSGNDFSPISQFQNVSHVEAHLAEYWKLQPNEYIAVGDEKAVFKIEGIIASPEYLMNMGSYADILPSPRRFGVIFMPLSTAQLLLDVPGKVNEISVRLDSSLSATTRESIAGSMKSFLEENHNLKLGEPIDIDKQVSYYLLRLDIEEAREFGFVLPLILLGMAMGGLYVLLGRMVVAERKDIGVAQALGYSRRTIISQYVGIGFIVAIIGTILGVILGIGFSNVFSPMYINLIKIPFPARVTFEWPLVVVGVVLGLATGLLGGYLPVRGAIQPLPAESLRFDPSLHITTGKVPLIERLLNKIMIRPRVTGLRLPLRNIFRSRRRMFSSVFAVVISVSLVTMGFGMVESMDRAFVVQYSDIEDWDLRIDFNEVPTNASDIVNALARLDGVSNGTYHLLSGATITSSKSVQEKTVQLIGIKKINGYLGHKFVFEAGNFSKKGIVLSVPVAEKLGVWRGDNVSLELPKLTKLVSTAPLRAHFEMENVTFMVSGIVDEFNGLVAYVGLDRLKEESNFPGSPANSIVLKLVNASTENLESIREQIWSSFSYNVRNIFTRAEQTTDLIDLISVIYAIMYVVAFFAVLLAVAMVYNTVYINLQEQQRELATLLTIGTPNRNIIRNVTVENLIITIIGTFFGLIFGWLLLWFFMDVILDLEFFRIKLFISLETMLLSFVLTFSGILIAQYFPLRNTINLNLAEATKERVV